jgi:hypothetical protein
MQAISGAAQPKFSADAVPYRFCHGIYREVLTDGLLPKLLNLTPADDLSI